MMADRSSTSDPSNGAPLSRVVATATTSAAITTTEQAATEQEQEQERESPEQKVVHDRGTATEEEEQQPKPVVVVVAAAETNTELAQQRQRLAVLNNTRTSTTTLSILAPPGTLGIGLQSAAEVNASAVSSALVSAIVGRGTGTGTGGAVVTCVRPSGVMAQKLWKGDHIVAIDGTDITRMESMKQILECIAQRIDYKRQLTVLRRTSSIVPNAKNNNSMETNTNTNNNTNNTNRKQNQNQKTNSNCHNTNGGSGVVPSTTIHADASSSSSSSSSSTAVVPTERVTETAEMETEDEARRQQQQQQQLQLVKEEEEEEKMDVVVRVEEKDEERIGEEHTTSVSVSSSPLLTAVPLPLLPLSSSLASSSSSSSSPRRSGEEKEEEETMDVVRVKCEEQDDEKMGEHQHSSSSSSVLTAATAPLLPVPVSLSASSSPRRSGRSRISTTMQIQGHTVLRKNNYRVQGDTYVFDDHDEDEKKEKKKTPAAKKLCVDNNNKSRRSVAIKEHPAEVKRKKHNQVVDESVRDKQPLRQSFLAKHLMLLTPFCEPKVVKQVKLDASMHKMKSDIDTNNKKRKAPSSSTSSSLMSSSPAKAATMVVSQPHMIDTAILRPYQLKGLDFMVRMHQQNLAMILGDEMGLGKTLQTISLLCHLKEQYHVTGPSLIICPLSVLSSWCAEMTKWAPTLKYIQLHASSLEEQIRQRRHLVEHATEYDVILTTYEMAKVPTLVSFYQRIKFHYLVLDEGHKIKGHETQISKTVRKIHAGNRLLLTGTPLQNNLVELWSLLNFLYPDIFTISEPFQEHFDLAENIVDKSFLAQTQQLLQLFMLRRLKKEVEKLIPDKLETKIYCPLSKSQTFWYKALLMKDVSRLANIDHKSSSSGNGDNNGEENTNTPIVSTNNHSLLRSLFMQLRKCSNHPFLFPGAETDPNETSLPDLIGASGKLSVLDMILRSLFQKGNRAVLFTQFTMLLDLVEDYCLLRGWKYCRLDGSTERARRNYLLKRFNEPNSPYFLFLMSTRSGGMGLNLQTADTCILFDSDWNPQSDIQAMARVHRIGQTRTVHVYRLVTSGTVEERMLERAEKKLLLEMVNQDSNEGNSNAAAETDAVARGMSTGELWEDIKFGCEAVFGNSANNELPSEEEIDNITDRTRKEADSVGKLTGGTSKTAKSFDATKEFSSTQLFGGTDFRKIRKQQAQDEKKKIPHNLQGIAHLWQDIKSLEHKKRERKSRIIQIQGKGSGYGSAYVPILAANNYDLLGGESSVFDRELKQSKKANFEVKKRDKSAQFENESICHICGDGGSLVCCPRCPNSVHLSCIGLQFSKEFLCCNQHRCTLCGKNRSDAGGLLFPCHACPNSFCEQCLPKERITFLEKVDRFENLGFDSTKNVIYINCSPMCTNYATKELGYIPAKKDARGLCPKAMDLVHHFGASADLDEARAAVEVEAEAESTSGRGRRARKVNSYGKPTRMIEKLCVSTKRVMGLYESISAAHRSVEHTHLYQLQNHLRSNSTQPFEGFYWRFQDGGNYDGKKPPSVVVESSVNLQQHASVSLSLSTTTKLDSTETTSTVSTSSNSSSTDPSSSRGSIGLSGENTDYAIESSNNLQQHESVSLSTTTKFDGTEATSTVSTSSNSSKRLDGTETTSTVSTSSNSSSTDPSSRGSAGSSGENADDAIEID